MENNSDNLPVDAMPLIGDPNDAAAEPNTNDKANDDSRTNGHDSEDKKQESAPTTTTAAADTIWKGTTTSNNIGGSSGSTASLAEQPLEKTNDHAADTANHEASAFMTSTHTTTRGGASRRGSSLELRKMPVNVLLRPESKLFDEELSVDDDGEHDHGTTKRNLLQRTCLNSKYTLRSQMMLSFGTISACTILLVVLVCISISILSGEVVKEKTRETFDHVANLLEARATRYIAEDLTPRLLMTEVVDVLVETTRDRFYGYPQDDDSKIPYFDALSQSNKYPIKGQPLPLDWQIEPNVNESNHQEHVQDRWFMFGPQEKISTANAAYYQQGMCDPYETNPAQVTYLEGCTLQHNNITTGGVYAPSPTNEQVHRKASDLGPLLKTLYEYHQDLLGLSILFSNSGAGASLTYPGKQLDGTSTYTSIGCDWLNQPHPLDNSRPILSPEDVDRCTNQGMRTENAKIPTRLYNPLDRGWCRNQILAPNQVVVEGPYLNAWTPKGKNSWLLSAGQAVYDPVTNELVACTHMSIDIHNSFAAILDNSKVSNHSHVSVVRWNPEGTVVASTAWDTLAATGTVTIAELDVGVTQEAYQQFYTLVDYTSLWNATEVQQQYEEFVIDEGDYQVKAYPIPPVPDQYDETYEPRFLVLFSVNVADVFVFARRVDTQVDDRVQSLTVLSVAVGLAGLVAVIAVLVAVSNYITRPLRNMNDTAKRIIDNFGEDTKIEVEDATKENGKSELVKTELTEIVKEFQRMVRKFSGGAMARSAKVSITEVDNQFKMMDEFQDLYASRQDKPFKYKVEPTNPTTSEDGGSEVGRQHFGSNILSGSVSTARSMSHANLLKANQENAYTSPLFRWIVALIVLPLLLSTITISTAVITSVSLELPDMINDAERGLIDLQISGLQAFATLRAGFVSKSSEHPIRDLHVQTRYASWLLFGGLEANAFPELLAATEPCKGYDRQSVFQCPYAIEEHVCDCNWDTRGYPCYNYTTDSRYLQKPYFVVSAQDADLYGDRSLTSYPDVATSPNTTAWRYDQFDVPGSPYFGISWLFNGTNISGSEEEFVQGYATTYQRIRTAAASPMYVPMTNYKSKAGNVLTTFVSFEADGLYLAHSGCGNVMHATNSLWKSTEENGAARLRGELCPLGLHGYDPRCRGWYDSGRSSFLADKDELHVTPAYVFSANSTGQSCTAPLFDPNTKEHLGQVLVDFISTRIYDSLDDEHTPLAKGGFHLLITMKSDVYGADVVLGPGLSITDPAKDVRFVVNARNESCKDSPCGFGAILKSMKAGERGTGEFILVDDDGAHVTYHVAYSPVVVKSFKQVNSSDFSRGVEHVPYKLYSLALAEPEASMLDSFERAEDDIRGVIHIGLAILCTVIVAAAGLVVWLSHRITISMTEPMYYLLELIRHINRLDVGEDPPEEEVNSGYGSSEVLNVRMTMEKLYKIIQCANAAYFAGETEVAYEVFTDALHLFTRLDNKKAMGVANNNLGNTMLTFYRTMQTTGDETVCGLTRRQIIGKGMAYFHQAIQLGEKAYDAFYEAEGWSPNCLHFMQHLSNRYFNRAMFLLTVKDDHEKPKEIEELGMRDLQIARDMDVEIVDEGTQVGWNVRSAEAHMEVLLCRIRGHVALLEMGYPDDWEVDEMLDAAFKLLKTELKKDSTATDLFTDIGPAGRMQQIEFLLMRYNVVNDDLETAAKIAIRMLVEDEFIIPEAQKKAIEVMVEYSETKNVAPDVLRRLKEYQEWLSDAVDELDTQRSSKEVENTRTSFVSNMPLSRRVLDPEKSLVNSVASLRESMRGDITMEAF